jgi:hypothetical protein
VGLLHAKDTRVSLRNETANFVKSVDGKVTGHLSMTGAVPLSADFCANIEFWA